MSTTTDPSSQAPAFVPLEANPELMTNLLHTLGLSRSLAVHDVYSLTEPSLLAFIPRPAHALLLVFPVSAAYESHRLAEDATVAPGGGGYDGRGEDEPVVWFRQTIRNACGLIGLLHAAANGEARRAVEPGTPLDRLLAAAVPLGPDERARLLERDPALAAAHQSAAEQGDTTAPAATDDVDLHYVCFVKGRDGALWELDGRRKGPLRRGDLDSSEDVLSEKALALGPLKFLEREAADLRFSCVALARSLD
ncbi:hypothetical protein MYCTH_2299037 [Thermothelomyces thermophilus ATCC 42464]|uniref:Ubiquitin carboxyl-terminal hydrolase n=1 Tax=Thermothelomyces thermophilus (strain ATCC 42464 / BCRC 31852 / DSM 1799) TaxID=573729 RepID=G2Q4D3_THET4|nr:uncharacterized protein MYCTH_2299037 [Thermothelomyces thermophilus ATCC 42464]AEO55328.1 hypothetical protein MYCTH_2299037 [Thermothelomyces thermophilus ATCC 42464]